MNFDRQFIAILCISAYGAIPILIGWGAIRLNSRNKRSRYMMVGAGLALICGLVAAASIFPYTESSKKYPETDSVFGIVFLIWFVSIGATIGALIDRNRFGKLPESDGRTT